jgi:hypothetical protein
MNLVPRLKRIVKPFLLPLLYKLRLRKETELEVPRISRSDQLRKDQVASIVTVRADETILLNGVPFFPIGLYYARDEIADVSGAGLRHLRSIGFNSIFFDGGLDSESELDRIWEAGLHVWYRPPGALHGDLVALKELVKKFGPHPAVLFWEMDDEPVLNQLSFSDMRVGCRVVRRLDPYHPILCNQWFSSFEQAEEMRRWAGLADVYGFDVYPVPLSRWGKRMSLLEKGWPHSVSVVGAQVELWRSYAPKKPIIPVLQAWAWNCLEDGKAGYPTYRESRFMAYHAVIRGAKGLHHYGAYKSSRPNFAGGLPPPKSYEHLDHAYEDFQAAQKYNDWFWSYYQFVINELAIMSDIFASADADRKLEVQKDEVKAVIEYRVKKYEDSVVLLIVNSSNLAATITVDLAELASQSLNVWGEARSIRVDSAGRFQDTLEPYNVRIYSVKPDRLSSFASLPLGGSA